jgi:citrate lyase subunit beta / citryl-CoA lyase
MEKTIAVAGNAGPKVRSDCEITLEIKTGGGLVIDLASKVKTLYGESIIGLVSEIAGFFGIKNACIKINDSGALPFVIAARTESAIKKLVPSGSDYLPEFLPENMYSTSRERFRFSRLYLPGNTRRAPFSRRDYS